MKPMLLGFAIFALLALTNPSTSAHLAAVEDMVMAAMPPTVGIWGGVGRSLIQGMLPSRDNYFVISLTIIRGEIIGIGVLGNVFILGAFKKEIATLTN